MDDDEFDNYLTKRLGTTIDPVTNKFVLNPLLCGCSINMPHRPPPRDDQEQLRRDEFMAEMTWGCECPQSVHDCLVIAQGRRKCQTGELPQDGFGTVSDSIAETCDRVRR